MLASPRERAGSPRGGPEKRRPGPVRFVALGLDPVPFCPAQDSRQRESRPTRVTRMTAKVRTGRVAFREGLRQSERRRQRDCAAKPGRADHEGQPRGESGSRAAITGAANGKQARGCTPASSAPTTTTPLTAPRGPGTHSAAGSRGSPGPSGSSNPISTNTKPLRTNPIIFQVVSHRTRLLGLGIVPEPAADDYRTAVTAADSNPTGRAGRRGGRPRTGSRPRSGPRPAGRRGGEGSHPRADRRRRRCAIPPAAATTKPATDFKG